MPRTNHPDNARLIQRERDIDLSDKLARILVEIDLEIAIEKLRDRLIQREIDAEPLPLFLRKEAAQ